MRGAVVGLALAAGFFFVFLLAGLAFKLIIPGRWLEELGWFAIVTGVLMVPLGIAMFRGFEPVVKLPRLNMGTGSRQTASVFLFGVSYAVVSLGCTLSLFIPTVIDSFTDDGIVDGLAVFIAYSLGMSLIVVSLTMGIALARNSIATSMRRVLPYVNKASGVLLVLAGVYLVSFGWDELKTFDDPVNAETSRFQKLAEDFESHLNGWVDAVGATRIGWALVVLIGAAFVLGLRASIVDRTRRNAVTYGFLGLYAVLELGWYQADLLLIPVARFVGDVPMRVGHWFTDPGRWAVPLEIALFAAIIGAGWLVVRRRLRPRPDRAPAVA